MEVFAADQRQVRSAFYCQKCRNGAAPMTKLKIRHKDWVVVCDGRKALILENLGDEASPNLRMKEVREHPDPPTHAQGTETPGRVQPSVGTARSAVEQTDWHDRAEKAFLEGLARHLDAAVAGGSTTRLIVAAAPRALGVLRQAYSPAVRHALQAEIDKDWVKTPILEIEKQLVG
jgi:protein required for attachment to host cells